MGDASASDKKELIAKLTRHVAARFGGTGSDAWRRAFKSADADHSGTIDAVELAALLEAAGVGNFLSIDAWVSGVMAELDRDDEDGISYPELEAVLVRSPPTSAVFEEAPVATVRPDYLYPLNYTPKTGPVKVTKTPKTPGAADGIPWGTLAVVALIAVLLGRRRG